MAGKNRIVRSVAPKSVLPDARIAVDSTVSYNQGDLLAIKSNKLSLLASEGDGQYFVGIADQTVVSGKVQSPYSGTAVDAAQALPQVAGPVYGVVAKLMSKTGEAWTVGCSAYADPSTNDYAVAATGTKAIGIYQGAAVASAAAGSYVEVLLGCRFVGDTLQF